MVPPIYKKPPGPKDTGGQTGNLLYKYYTTHWQNVNDTMLIWCGLKMSTFNAKVFSCFFTFSNMHISKQLYLCILYNYMFLMGVGVGSGS